MMNMMMIVIMMMMMMPRDLQCVITHSLYNLSPAPYLNKHIPLPYNKYKHGALASGYYNVYRDTKVIQNQVGHGIHFIVDCNKEGDINLSAC